MIYLTDDINQKWNVMELSDAAKEYRRKKKAEWRAKNKEDIREYDRQWRAKNPDKKADHDRRYWERKALTESDTLDAKVMRMHKAGESLRAIAEALSINHMKAKRIIDKYKDLF